MVLTLVITCEGKGMEGREREEYGPTSKGLDRKGKEMGRERKGGEGEERVGSSLPSNKIWFPRA